MAKERFFADVVQKLVDAKKTGFLFISVVEESEDLIGYISGTERFITSVMGPPSGWIVSISSNITRCVTSHSSMR